MPKYFFQHTSDLVIILDDSVIFRYALQAKNFASGWFHGGNWLLGKVALFACYILEFFVSARNRSHAIELLLNKFLP
ncbi:hypothetical protein QUB49_15265 [Microcoleus sp. AT9_B4]